MAGAQHIPELASLRYVVSSGQIRRSRPSSLMPNPSPVARVSGSAAAPSTARFRRLRSTAWATRWSPAMASRGCKLGSVFFVQITIAWRRRRRQESADPSCSRRRRRGAPSTATTTHRSSFLLQASAISYSTMTTAARRGGRWRDGQGVSSFVRQRHDGGRWDGLQMDTLLSFLPLMFKSKACL